MTETSEEKQLHAHCQRSLPNKFKNIRFEGKLNQPAFFLNDKKSDDSRLAIVDIAIYDDEWDPKIVIEIEPDANPKTFFGILSALTIYSMNSSHGKHIDLYYVLLNAKQHFKAQQLLDAFVSLVNTEKIRIEILTKKEFIEKFNIQTT